MLNLNDEHIGILAELYWNGKQYSRITPDLRKEIEDLIEEGFIEEFSRDMIFFGMEWFVKLTDEGEKVLKAADPVRVFDYYMRTADSTGTLQAAVTWVSEFVLDQLPEALAHEEEDIRTAAVGRLEELTRGAN